MICAALTSPPRSGPLARPSPRLGRTHAWMRTQAAQQRAAQQPRTLRRPAPHPSSPAESVLTFAQCLVTGDDSRHVIGLKQQILCPACPSLQRLAQASSGRTPQQRPALPLLRSHAGLLQVARRPPFRARCHGQVGHLCTRPPWHTPWHTPWHLPAPLSRFPVFSFSRFSLFPFPHGSRRESGARLTCNGFGSDNADSFHRSRPAVLGQPCDAAPRKPNGLLGLVLALGHGLLGEEHGVLLQCGGRKQKSVDR